MQKPVTLSVTFVPPLETNENMTCRLGGRLIPKDITSDQIQCTIPGETRSRRTERISCNVSAIQYSNLRFLILYKCK